VKILNFGLLYLGDSALPTNGCAYAGDKPIRVHVDAPALCSALLPHQLAEKYSSAEELIRDYFDRFLKHARQIIQLH
jgi:hypothetical protein